MASTSMLLGGVGNDVRGITSIDPASISGRRLDLNSALGRTTTAPQLVTNGTFEVNVLNWTAGSGAGGDLSTWSRNTSSPIAGTADAHGASVVGGGSRYADITLASGQEYTITFSAKRTGDAGTVTISLRDSTSQTGGSIWSGFSNIALAGSGTQGYSQTFTSGAAGTARLHIIGGSALCDFFIDSISLKHTGVLDGDTLTAWADQSGSANNAGGGVSPIYKATSFNGFPAIRFNGTTQYLLGGPISGSGVTIIAALNLLTIPSSSVVVLFDNCTGDPLTNGGFSFLFEDRVSTGLVSSPALIAKAGATASREFGKSNSYPAPANVVVGLAYSGISGDAYVLGTADQAPCTVVAGSGTGAYSASAQGYVVGALNDASLFANMDLARLIVWDTRLTLAQIQGVCQYLKTAYGI